MVDRWWAEAQAHQVLPARFDALLRGDGREPVSAAPLATATGRVPVRWPSPARSTCAAAPHEVSVDVDIPDPADEAVGVLVSQGSGFGGWVLWVAGGRLHYAHNHVSMEESRVESDHSFPPGATGSACATSTAPVPAGGGVATLVIDGDPCGSLEIPRFTLTRWSICGDGLTVGRSMALPVVRRLGSPRSCSPGTIHEVTIDVDGGPSSTSPPGPNRRCGPNEPSTAPRFLRRTHARAGQLPSRRSKARRRVAARPTAGASRPTHRGRPGAGRRGPPHRGRHGPAETRARHLLRPTRIDHVIVIGVAGGTRCATCASATSWSPRW